MVVFFSSFMPFSSLAYIGVHFIVIMSQLIIQCMTSSDNDDGDDEI